MNLRLSHIIDSEIEGHYAFYPFVEEITTQEHQHDFYELFLIASGSVYHHVNGECSLLTSGHLVLIRPDDVHYYRKHTHQNCELINLAFLAKTVDELSEYLGVEIQDDPRLMAPLPPTVLLTTAEKNLLISQLKSWGQLMYRDKTRSRVALRALLAQIIGNLFIARSEDYRADMPLWLVEVCQQMHKREYLVEGRGALMRLANRTPEYVGRVFKTHLDTTPSRFINNLRLDYASDLLLKTDRPVIEICYDVGFENLSHFYHLFKARWVCSPNQYRKLHQRTVIP